ncbi:hypothetical protein [Campylobacter hyointestinalis]|uniref:Lipoprotein n=1 Tax=Campylobacter hyointestinalis subsp. hyointestinalis TaxID=91352 RepID=A0A0S4S7H7_CAMHY|nr:hypothetical protein [Campylobacter hyointestinalis]PPB54982.1 hypothetical protein CDQ69_02655 [Campylobacter hyointestinalis subsp. hyointestinalis]PPB55470.1 hypothetical protein CDQ67_05360 [Campylobacter hyointestinalis subsp. hyointestinalis]PPB57581.1 hypothetical protein CDQ71_06825 [Campylobacter hyointestinalis subsp. hyointestinalis]PPB58612.1 hypothetical protein CDQ70_04665 [Campylobacter hyointestinalis subsp. hyointestinalis]PPB60476.1 hypothetical protein CDQ72_07760 [Campyl
MRNLAIFVLLALLFTGCVNKHTPEPNIIYKEKLVPVKCNALMPIKPNNDDTFEADKAIMIYYRECESLLKQCIGIQDGK